MPSRGRSSWPGRGGQSTRGRGAFQNRQEQAPPATPPPSPRLSSQNNRLPTRGQTYYRGRGHGGGSVCWVCQREGCYSWNHPPLENHEPPTPPPLTVRHCVVQHRRGQDATYVEPTVVTLTSTVEMRETFTSLHRSSQVKFSYRSRSRKTSFGVRVRANGLRLFLRARALIRSSVGLRPTDT